MTGTAVLLADQGAAHPVCTTPSNVGHYPPDDLLRMSPSGGRRSRHQSLGGLRYKSTIPNGTGGIDHVRLAPGLNDSIALLNMEATSVSLVVTDQVEGEVYNETINLISDRAVIDWFSYFFEDIGSLTTDIVRLNMPLYTSASLTMTISYPGGTAKIGGIIIGKKKYLGTTRIPPASAFTDYSKKNADDDAITTSAKARIHGR